MILANPIVSKSTRHIESLAGSYVYLAVGNIDLVHVMKIGKANNLDQREKQIGITITHAVRLKDEQTAFRVESQFREMLRVGGAKQFAGTNDWFEFRQSIFKAIMAQFELLNQVSPETSDNAIEIYMQGYNDAMDDAAQVIRERQALEINNLTLRLYQERANIRVIRLLTARLQSPDCTDADHDEIWKQLDMLKAGWNVPVTDEDRVDREVEIHIYDPL